LLFFFYNRRTGTLLHARDIPYLPDMEYLNNMTNYFLPLQPGTFYHIYNRGNNGETIFYKRENYFYFLRKVDHYLSPYVHVYAYCLLPNHFHILVQTKEKEEVGPDHFQMKTGTKTLTDFSPILSEAFRRLFLSYSKSIKMQEGRTGSLFEKNFKRKEIANDQHLYWLVNYIHRNPETHGIARDFCNYPHSSYTSLLSSAPTKLKRTEVLALLGGREEFIRFHATNPVVKDQETVVIE